MGKFSVFPVSLSKGSDLLNKRHYTNSQKNAFAKRNQGHTVKHIVNKQYFQPQYHS